jgi:hypothetical protein
MTSPVQALRNLPSTLPAELQKRLPAQVQAELQKVPAELHKAQAELARVQAQLQARIPARIPTQVPAQVRALPEQALTTGRAAVESAFETAVGQARKVVSTAANARPRKAEPTATPTSSAAKESGTTK